MGREAGGGYSDVGEMQEEVIEQNLNLHLSLRRLPSGLSPQGLYTRGPSGLETVTASVCAHSSTVSWHSSCPCSEEGVGLAAAKWGAGGCAPDSRHVLGPQVAGSGGHGSGARHLCALSLNPGLWHLTVQHTAARGGPPFLAVREGTWL